MPFFDGDLLPEPRYEYVLWLDVMGIQSAMSKSLRISANFVFKLHIAGQEASHARVRIYPVMDGMYVASEQQAEILRFARETVSALASDFIRARDQFHRFVVRGALAHGPVYHGASVPDAVADVFRNDAGRAYKNTLLVGMPMVQAHSCEGMAPPFGIFVHESARAPAGGGRIPHVWWKWINGDTKKIWDDLLPALRSYYGWCKSVPDEILYAKDRISVHEDLATQYLTDVPTEIRVAARVKTAK